MATAGLVLKHQAISSHNAEKIFIVLDQFHTKILHLLQKTLEYKITFWKNIPSFFSVKSCPKSKWSFVLWNTVLSHVQSFNVIMTSSNGNIFHITGPLWGESTGHGWIPFTKASDAELCCCLWSAPKQTVAQAIEWFEMPSRSLWSHCNDVPPDSQLAPSCKYKVCVAFLYQYKVLIYVQTTYFFVIQCLTVLQWESVVFVIYLKQLGNFHETGSGKDINTFLLVPFTNPYLVTKPSGIQYQENKKNGFYYHSEWVNGTLITANSGVCEVNQ